MNGARAAIWVVVGAGLALRLAWGIHQGGAVDPRLPDQGEYVQMAQNLLAGRGLEMVDPHFGDAVYAYRSPGYPMFLASLGANCRVARAAQAILDASTILATYLLARRWLGIGVSLIAATVIALDPFLTYFSGLILSETLFTALLAWSMVLLVWRRNVVWGGLLLALGVLVRPSAVVLPVAMGIGAALLGRTKDGLFRSGPLGLPVGATMVLLVVLALLPWGWRNHRVLGQWVWLSSNGGVTLYDGFHAEAAGGSDQTFMKDAGMRFLGRLGELERDRVLSEMAWQWLRQEWRDRPMRIVELEASKIKRMWSPILLSQEFGTNKLYLGTALLFSIPLDLMVVVAVWRGGVPRTIKVFLLLPAVYLTAVHAMSVGSLRYRIPVDPPMAVLAAVGVESLGRVLGRPGWRRDAVAD